MQARPYKKINWQHNLQSSRHLFSDGAIYVVNLFLGHKIFILHHASVMYEIMKANNTLVYVTIIVVK